MQKRSNADPSASEEEICMELTYIDLIKASSSSFSIQIPHSDEKFLLGKWLCERKYYGFKILSFNR
jgi:hypothetical protein